MPGAKQLSPGVQIREIDLTNFVPTVGTSGGAFVGNFSWGPVNKTVLINDANQLARVFGEPNDTNYADWFSASNFLAYNDNLRIVRVVDNNGSDQALNSSNDGSGLLVENADHYQALLSANQGLSEWFVAKYPGVKGDSLKVSMADSKTFDTWLYKDEFDFQPPGTSAYAENLGASNDEIHVVVVDEDGKFTGVPGAVLERFAYLSKSRDARSLDNEPIYYRNVINLQSDYVWVFEPVKGSVYLDIEGFLGSATLGNPYLGIGSNFGKPIITFEDTQDPDNPENRLGVGGTASAVVDNGVIKSITVANKGAGYTGPVTVNIIDSGEGASAVGVVSGVNKILSRVLVSSVGRDYYTAKVVVEDGGSGATATAVLSTTGSVKTAVLHDAGSGYTAADVLTIATGTGGTFIVDTVDGSGAILTGHLGAAGSGYSATATDVATTGGTGVGGTVDITVGKTIASVTVTNAGDEYGTAIVSFTGGNPTTPATAHASFGIGLSTGRITGITVDTAGAGYETVPTVTITPGGSGAFVTAVIGDVGSPQEGQIIEYVVTNSGSNYGNPKIIVTPGGTISDDCVAKITINNAGTGYVAGDELSVSGNGVGDTDAVFTVDTVDGSGAILTGTLTVKGDGYTADGTGVALTGGTGSSATADTVIGELNGIEITITPDDSSATNWGDSCTTSTGVPITFYSLQRTFDGAASFSLGGGTDGAFPSAGNYMRGWDLFKNAEDVDVTLLFVGPAGGTASSKPVIRHVIDNIAEWRRDCVVFFSPNLTDVLNKEQSAATAAVRRFVSDPTGINRSTSFAVADSGWKLQYDVFADKYRWIPLNADIAGLCAQTETDYESWWSPAGFNRGHIKNIAALAFNPTKGSRDELYKANINSVTSFTGEGTVLFGDRTLLIKPSAFSYINVRRLFITLEKAIGRAAKYYLFEFNDSFTRQQFVGMVEPYLRMVKAKRGIYDFKVVCDESNNTPEVIDRAEFIASIFIKPARSINFITLNFVAVRTGVEFSEVVGMV